MTNRIKDLLLSTKRPGMDELIEWMESNGFFTAPCSSQYHLCKEGGLAEHSLNVYGQMFAFARETQLNDDLEWTWMNSIAITSLLHDLGKTGQFGKQSYIPNIIKDGRPTKAEPDQKYKISEAKPFTTNSDLLYIPHEVRSIQIASQYIELTEEENWAILMHNGLYGDFKYSIRGKETPLYLLLHFADMWCSRVVEKEVKGSEE